MYACPVRFKLQLVWEASGAGCIVEHIVSNSKQQNRQHSKLTAASSMHIFLLSMLQSFIDLKDL